MTMREPLRFLVALVHRVLLMNLDEFALVVVDFLSEPLRGFLRIDFLELACPPSHFTGYIEPILPSARNTSKNGSKALTAPPETNADRIRNSHLVLPAPSKHRRETRLASKDALLGLPSSSKASSYSLAAVWLAEAWIEKKRQPPRMARFSPCGASPSARFLPLFHSRVAKNGLIRPTDVVCSGLP